MNSLQQSEKWEHFRWHYTPAEVLFAVYRAPSSKEWQKLRVQMKLTSLEHRLKMLTRYLTNCDYETNKSEWILRRIRIWNYVNALKRGGIIR